MVELHLAFPSMSKNHFSVSGVHGYILGGIKEEIRDVLKRINPSHANTGQ